LRTVFEIEKKREKISEIEKELQNPQFWKNKERATEISREYGFLKDEVSDFDKLKKEVELINSEENLEKAIRDIKEKEIIVYLSGRYDRGGAVLSIFAGAGGRDSEDWVAMLLRMYEKYFQRKRFKTKILHQSFSEGGGPEGRIGIKSVTLEVKGRFAYGLLKNETGVHRLVRISPFSPRKLRHTSFALVEVVPEILKPEDIKIKINTDDLKIDFYRSSGPGGQYVNKKETAVRITHLPTGITATCQSERSQIRNRERAMSLLYARLYRFFKEKKEKELSQIKGGKVSVSWGNQIRSYVLHPYKMIKDLRTGVEIYDVDKVLDGEIDEFITAELKIAKND